MKIYFTDNSDKLIEIEDSAIENKLSDFNNKHAKLFDYCCDTRQIVYTIATVADKEINYRIYPYDSLLNTVKQNKWLKPYAKPLLKNHDSDCEPLGRIIKSSFYDHTQEQVIAGDDIPQEVIDEFKKRKLFKKGTASVILGAKVSYWIAESIKDGIYLTTSQGSATDSLACSICGKPIRECEHSIGKDYEKKKCLAITGELEPMEISVVNEPANDTSLMLVYEPSSSKEDSSNTTGTVIMFTTSDSKKEPVIITTDNSKGERKMDLEKLALQILKVQKDKIVKSFGIEDEKVEALTKDFSLEALHALIALTDTLMEVKDGIVTSLKDQFETEKKELTDAHEVATKELKDEIEVLKATNISLEDNAPAQEPEPVATPEPVAAPEPTPEPVVDPTQTEDKTQNFSAEENSAKIEDGIKIPDFTESGKDKIKFNLFNNKSIADSF